MYLQFKNQVLERTTVEDIRADQKALSQREGYEFGFKVLHYLIDLVVQKVKEKLKKI